MKNKKTYVCHVSECSYNNGQGGCCYDSDCVTVALYDGRAICPNFTPVDNEKRILAEGLLKALKEVLLELHGDEMIEDLKEYELCTDGEGNCFMCRKDNGYSLQALCQSRQAAALVDAYNVLLSGKVLMVESE